MNTMSLKWAAAAIAALGAAAVGYGLWLQSKDPPRTVSVGTVEIPDPRRNDGGKMRLLTRVQAVGGIARAEVELPNGTWIDCGGDCAGAVHKATAGFWDEQQKKRK
jgi:hypothetical protein